MSQAGSPRGATGLFRPRGTNVLALAKVGKKSTTITPMFALLASVTIPPRPFIGFGQRLAGKIDNIIGDFVERYQSK